ncbi:MAG: hypothetical protein KBD21_02680 [Candidatus Pacebacteria bacterium]|nr:hypothetical protein [Candidatus Paceibacterota bacterium]
MIRMRQPFFSIASAIIYMLCAIGLAALATQRNSVILSGTTVPDFALWALCGLSFIMAYFSLVHLKFK